MKLRFTTTGRTARDDIDFVASRDEFAHLYRSVLASAFAALKVDSLGLDDEAFDVSLVCQGGSLSLNVSRGGPAPAGSTVNESYTNHLDELRAELVSLTGGIYE